MWSLTLNGQAVSKKKMFEHCERTTTTTTTTDAGAWVYYKLTFWAWRLRWAKNPGGVEPAVYILLRCVWMYFVCIPNTFFFKVIPVLVTAMWTDFVYVFFIVIVKLFRCIVCKYSDMWVIHKTLSLSCSLIMINSRDRHDWNVCFCAAMASSNVTDFRLVKKVLLSSHR